MPSLTAICLSEGEKNWSSGTSPGDTYPWSTIRPSSIPWPPVRFPTSRPRYSPSSPTTCSQFRRSGPPPPAPPTRRPPSAENPTTAPNSPGLESVEAGTEGGPPTPYGDISERWRKSGNTRSEPDIAEALRARRRRIDVEGTGDSNSPRSGETYVGTGAGVPLLHTITERATNPYVATGAYVGVHPYVGTGGAEL